MSTKAAKPLAAQSKGVPKRLRRLTRTENGKSGYLHGNASRYAINITKRTGWNSASLCART
jgi:hypothetical protein